MTATLYLEGNFLPDFTLRPNLFYLKLAKATREVLLISDVVSTDLSQWLKLQNPNLILTYLSTTEALTYLKNADHLKKLSQMELFIEDRDGSIPKEIYRLALNAFPIKAYVLARWIDWVSSSKSTLTVGFQSLSVTKSVINQASELYQFVELFPESETDVLQWQKELHRVPMGAYYLFHKGNPKLPAFSIYDSNQGQMIREEPSLEISTEKLDVKDLFLTLERIEELLSSKTNQNSTQRSEEKPKELEELKLLIRQYLRFEYGLDKVAPENENPIRGFKELIYETHVPEKTGEAQETEEIIKKEESNVQSPMAVENIPKSDETQPRTQSFSLQQLFSGERNNVANESLFEEEEEK